MVFWDGLIPEHIFIIERYFYERLKVSDAGQAQGGEDLLPPHRLHTPPQCDEVEGGCWCFHTLGDFSRIVHTEKWP